MKTSIKFLLWEKQHKGGKEPIYVRITRRGKPTYFSTGEWLKPTDWNDEFEACQNNFQGKARLDRRLISIKEHLHDIIDTLDKKGGAYESTDIKGIYLNKIEKKISFSEYFKQFYTDSEYTKAYATYKKEINIFNKLNKFANNKELEFTDITVNFLNKYELFCIKTWKNAKNTIARDLRTLRAVINKAINEGIILVTDNPFKKYKLPSEKTHRNYLTREELNNFRKIYINPKHIMYHYRNMFLFGCYTGLRVSDILQLKWQNFDGTSISIVMQKTDDTLNNPVIPNAFKMLEEYKNAKYDSDYVFPVLDKGRFDLNSKIGKSKAISSANASCNRFIKIIAKSAEINKNVHFHISRHTFATLALSSGVDIFYVQKLLGHSKIKSTQIYTKIIDTDLKKVVNGLDF